ncbi:LLM class flavin-dependent oxidoreductase [Streptomyces sp. PTM05]|uniref:LLM class flavin-dependent oxidoreductase n=1 Tax=Streptantibioticus parmotrematis TaxID=2873249 RepID=A0ABS7QQI5_9ACTN|nr:LLM class flavin-dependent oxidoreductase [Streptantibioticus parmotrematis]MBY8885459.1 LLM class flavin-dependent oxidoreductase [Streptantibioticus parmotrematis]
MPQGTLKPRLADDRMRFGLMWLSSPTPTTTSKEVADLNPDPFDVDAQMDLARRVEDAGFDYVFFADGYIPHGENSWRIGHAEPHMSAPVFAPVVMAATRHIGVVTTFHTRYFPPAVIARLGANLDVLSGGRWGWNIVPGWKPDELALLGITVPDSSHETRYATTAEAVEAVKRLWAARGEQVDFEGEFFRLHGKMISPHPVQDPPCLFNAGVSPVAQELIADTCDFAFTPLPDDYAKMRAMVEGLAERTERHGRSPLEVNMAGATGIVLGRSDREAQEKYDWVRESLDMDCARDIATELMGGSETYKANYEGEFDDVARTLGIACGSKVLVGSPSTVAEQILDMHRETGIRGFMFLPSLYAAQDIELIGQVFPYLEKADVWTPPADRGWSW